MTPSFFATLPEPPYYCVVFASRRTDVDGGYEAMAGYMVERAALQPGYLGVESVRDAEGNGITVSYWESLEAIAAWKADAHHRAAKEQGKAVWYERYELRIARVERAYGTAA